MSGIDTTQGIDVAGQRAAQGTPVWAVPYDFKGPCDHSPDICLGVPYCPKCGAVGIPEAFAHCGVCGAALER